MIKKILSYKKYEQKKTQYLNKLNNKNYEINKRVKEKANIEEEKKKKV